MVSSKVLVHAKKVGSINQDWISIQYYQSFHRWHLAIFEKFFFRELGYAQPTLRQDDFWE